MASKAKSNTEPAPKNFGVLEVKSCPVNHRRHVHQIDKSGREFCCSSGKEVVEKTNQNVSKPKY
jgi:hypothetical protein